MELLRYVFTFVTTLILMNRQQTDAGRSGPYTACCCQGFRTTISLPCISVDESMVQYFGKSGNALKQRMPMKEIRSGNKVWSLNVDNGYNIIPTL